MVHDMHQVGPDIRRKTLEEATVQEEASLMISRTESEHLLHLDGWKHVTRQGQAGNSFISCIICQSIHLEKTVLDVSVRISGRSSDEV